MSWGEMAYYDSGNLPSPLIFLHGTGCDASDWMPVIDGLPRNQRCIALDFRGHGQSTVKPAFQEFRPADPAGHPTLSKNLCSC